MVKFVLDGVLFVDEVYVLIRGSLVNDFGLEAIDILVLVLENYCDCMVVIFVGYFCEME